MSKRAIDLLILASACILVIIGSLLGHAVRAKADDENRHEVPPYAFADLPHGRVYKAVHEGCELYIVENDFQIPGGQYGTLTNDQHSYAITAARGCR